MGFLNDVIGSWFSKSEFGLHDKLYYIEFNKNAGRLGSRRISSRCIHDALLTILV